MPTIKRLIQRIRQPELTHPPAGASNYVLLILDSCRFDALLSARPQTMCKLGPIERRFSYATWTAPAHYNLLMGLLPHPSPSHVFASTHYKQDLEKFAQRLNIPSLAFTDMIPRMWLPNYLKNELGYRTRALVSMPVLNPHTPLAVDFDSWEMTAAHNDLDTMIDQMVFDEQRPTFYLLNTGETHYPYAAIEEPERNGQKIHGAHGVFKKLSQGQLLHKSQPQFFDQRKLDELRQRQIQVLARVDRSVERLFDKLPPNTYVTITSDHGELFGEDGYFGHGPINHEKVLEVPLIEGRLR